MNKEIMEEDICGKDRVRGALIGREFGRAVKEAQADGYRLSDFVLVGITGRSHRWPLAKIASEAGEWADRYKVAAQNKYAAAAFAMIIHLCLCAEHLDQDVFKTIVARSLETVEEIYGASDDVMRSFRKAIEEAVRMADDDGGWRKPEWCEGADWSGVRTLVTAVFSVLRLMDDFEGCLKCASELDGDEECVVEVAGGLIGAIIGFDAIPKKMTDGFKCLDTMLKMADTMSVVFPM